MTTPVINDQTLIRQTTPATGITVPMPASTQDADFLLLVVLDTIAAPLVPPTGWAEFSWSPSSSGTPTARMRTFWKIAASEAGTISLTKSVADDWIGAIYDITGCDVDSGAIVSSNGVSTAASSSSTNPGILVSADGTLLVWLFSADTGPTFSAPPAGFLLASQDQLPNDWAFGAASVPTPVTGSDDTGPITAPLTGSATSNNALIALFPLPLRIAPTTCDDGQVGVDYVTASLLGISGIPPYSYQVIGGALPPGVTLTNTVVGPNVRGVFGGTPTISGAFDFAVRVTDSIFSTFDQPYSIIIQPGEITLSGHAATGTVGTLAARTACSMIGHAASGGLGAFASSAATGLLGRSAIGSIGVLASGVVLSLTGHAASGESGELAPQSSIDMAGHAARGAVGALTSSRQVTVRGVAGTGAVGRLWPPFTSDPNYIVRYVYRGNTVRFNPWRGNDDEGIP